MSTEVPAAPKNKRKLLILLTAGAATLLLIVILLAVLLSGDSPESVVEDYLEAEFNGDQVTMSELQGFDPWDNYIATMYSLDDEINQIENGLLYYEYEDELDLDYNYWYDRLYAVEDEEHFYEFWLDYGEAEAKAMIEAYDASYEILTITTYELSGSDRRDARNEVRDTYAYWKMMGYAPEYDLDEIDAYYEVTVSAMVEYDGDSKLGEQTMLAIKEGGGYYIAKTYWYGS